MLRCIHYSLIVFGLNESSLCGHWCICVSITHIYFFQDVRRKVARVVAAKCTLAARVDSFHENPEGEVGQGIQHVHVYLQMCISICYYTFWSGVAGLSARLPEGR